MIKEAIIKLSNKQDIGYNMAKEVMNEIMSGKASDIQKSAYLTALSMKGETIGEITASAEEMRNHCIKLLHDKDVLEIVGTGGDGSNSFNISTTSSIVIAAGGVPVAKHGNRAASSKCGAADVLEALGVNITISPEKSTELLNKIGICFLFAQNYHIAMKYVAPVRKELGIRTVFNVLGPLSNPAGANIELMGVYDEELVEPLARVLDNLGVKRALVVYGEDKLDEISMSAATKVCEIKNGKFYSYKIRPEDFGFERCNKEELVGTTLNVRLIDFSRDNLSKIVASRRIILEEAKAQKEKLAWDSLNEGDVVKAEIKRFTKFGAFAEINGIDGLIHLSQLSWKHVNSCEEILKIGEIVDVKILSLDKEEKKLSLSIKALTPEPWSVVEEKYAVNSAVLGKVVRINDFGAFVELEPGIDGLVHISKISHDHIKHPSEILKIDEEVKCIILSIDKENKRIALSIKDAQ